MPLENFNTKEYSFNVNPDYYKWKEHSIKWTDVTRNTPGEIRKKFELPLFNAKIQFDLTINSIQNFGERNRLLITLVRLRNEPGTILSTYVEETAANDEYKIVFFQRKDGQNVFVYTSVNLKINIKYRITFRKEKFIFSINIDKVEPTVEAVDHSPELIGIEETYNDISLTQGHSFTTDPDDSISGILEQLFIDKIEEEITIKEDKKEIDLSKPKKAFISFCYRSGNDFADHLDKGLRENKVETFYSERNISLGEDWEEEIEKNIENSVYVILIITPGYEQRRMVQREVSIALNYGKLKVFKHKEMSKKHLCIELTSDYKKTGKEKDLVIYDFNSKNYEEFECKEDLLRQVYYLLDKEGWFDQLVLCKSYVKEDG